MTWAELCDGKVTDGKNIVLSTILGQDVEHNKRDKTNMPDSVILAQMVKLANNLKIKTQKGKGIAFNVATCTVGANNTAAAQSKYNEFVNQKPGASVCYEDTILPMNLQDGHILVHQSVAPCKRCRSGYSAWAHKRGCTIVVSADEGYDGCKDNSVFLFAPTKLVLYG